MDRKYASVVTDNPQIVQELGQGENPQGFGFIEGSQGGGNPTVQKEKVKAALASTLGNAAETARLAGMSRDTALRVIDRAYTPSSSSSSHNPGSGDFGQNPGGGSW